MTLLPAFAGYHSYNSETYTNNVLFQWLKSLIRWFVGNMYYEVICVGFFFKLLSHETKIEPAYSSLERCIYCNGLYYEIPFNSIEVSFKVEHRRVTILKLNVFYVVPCLKSRFQYSFYVICFTVWLLGQAHQELHISHIFVNCIPFYKTTFLPLLLPPRTRN